MPFISCVIPCYNEKRTISRVVKTTAKCSLIKQIIVVDDCSTDGSFELLQKLKKEVKKLKVLHNQVNLGKSGALKKGLRMIKDKFILLLDADLIGFNQKDLISLLNPVLKGRCAMTISFRKNTFRIYKLFKTDPFSGERVLPKALLTKALNHSHRFELELFINHFALKSNLSVGSVLVNFENKMKWRKYGFFRGWWGDIKMAFSFIKHPILYWHSFIIMRESQKFFKSF